jgi:hypothetical protein
MRVSPREYDFIKQLRTNPNSDEFLEACKTKGIDPTNVPLYWDKDKRYSIMVKQPQLEIYKLEQEIAERISCFSPKIKRYRRKPVKDGHCLVLDPADIHIGKLVSVHETGEEYNDEIAVERVDRAVEGILNRALGFNLDRIILVIGNDVLHVDNPKGTTTKGTPQDTSSMWFDMFLSAEKMYVRVIERLLPIADIEVVYNPSNHDYSYGFMLAQTIRAYFRQSDNIEFNVSISHRKYTKYGNSMIGTSHGDGAKLKDVPLLMATESPQMWNDCTYRYCYLHHVHHKIKTLATDGKDFIGVTIEYLRSPAASDSWHHRNGYTGQKKAVEGFLHSKNEGQVARFTFHV